MRPTDLQLRNPAEQTTEYGDHNMTYTGHHLTLNPKLSSIKGSFQCDQRFITKMESFVGPGQYNPQESFKKLNPVRCQSVLKMPSNYQLENAHEYIVVGSCVKHISNLKNTGNQNKSLIKKVRMHNNITDSMSVQQILREHRYDQQQESQLGHQCERIEEEKPFPSIEYENHITEPTADHYNNENILTYESLKVN